MAGWKKRLRWGIWFMSVRLLLLRFKGSGLLEVVCYLVGYDVDFEESVSMPI